jgi:hypothetical protein
MNEEAVQVEVETNEPLLEEDNKCYCLLCDKVIGDDEIYYSVGVNKIIPGVDEPISGYEICEICEKCFEDSKLELHLFRKDEEGGVGIRLCEEQRSNLIKAI